MITIKFLPQDKDYYDRFFIKEGEINIYREPSFNSFKEIEKKLRFLLKRHRAIQYEKSK